MSNPLAALLGYQLRRASAVAMDELTRDLTEIDLRPTEASVLTVVGANPGVTASEVGRELAIQRANMTPLVASLERRGFLAREPVDGRSQGLELTPLGETVRLRALAIMRAHDQRLLLRMRGQGADQLATLLRDIWMASEPAQASA